MHASNSKKKPLQVSKRIKATLSTLYAINLTWMLDEEN